ncbi:unnamed protein product [Victoria cruziana]
MFIKYSELIWKIIIGW